MQCNRMRQLMLAGLIAVVCLGSAWAAEQRAFTIQEPFGLAWGPDRVSYPVDFPAGAVLPTGVQLTDETGQRVPVQLSDITLWTDKKSVKHATVSFMVTLTPNQKKIWTLTGGKTAMKPVKTDLHAAKDPKRGRLELQTSKTGVRLPYDNITYKTPLDASIVSAPLQGVKLPDGRWIGRGWWQTDVKCTGYHAELTDKGPVFARAKLRYDFEGGKFYAATVELNAGQDLAVVSEAYNLSEGKAYPMSGSNGMKPEMKYSYVPPKFDSPDQALIWDWWGQTMAVLPTFNAYHFSFGTELQADSAEFYGRSQYNNLLEGDGGLKYDKDGRFAYLNAFLQWGDEETLYLGLYNAKKPETMLGMVTLSPSQWMHPDIDPHPDSLLKQYVQTTCITFERKKTGDVFFRAPADLGKRVYGIGGITRTNGKHLLNERSGPRLSDADAWGGDLMLRHVRLGRLRLQTVKDWVLDYNETAPLPAQTGVANKKVVDDAIARARHLVHHFAQSDKGNMDFGLDEDAINDACHKALANPACTPQQAKELRKWLAAICYYAIDPDFTPPRTAGFAWGSANMEAQVQCRACYLAALLPNHPQGKSWRQYLSKVVTLYLESQVNDSGVTLECPHYGTMAIDMPAKALMALATCGDADLARADKRLAAAAHTRLQMLLPYDIRGGFRAGGTEGDGYYMPEELFGTLGDFFKGRNPQLERDLAWGLKMTRHNPGPQADSNSEVPAAELNTAPKLGSEHIPGFGVIMRNGFPRVDENYLQIYADGFSWGHGHNDRGTWLMYAKGVPLMMDFAAMYTPSMREQWLHPGGLTFNHDEVVRPATEDPKNDWWRKSADADYRKLTVAPFTDVEPGPDPDAKSELDTFGKITAFRSSPQADYAEMQRNMRYFHRVPFALKEVHGLDLFSDGVAQEVYVKNAFTWTRRFVFVKDADPMGHNYLVIRDDLPGNSELDPYLNLWCLASKLDINGQLATYTGQHGVDLHCYVANPATFTAKTRTVGHPCGFGFRNYYEQKFGKPFREDQIQLQIPQAKRDGGYFVVMVPVKQGEATPKFETLANGRAVRVTFPDRVDTIVLQGKGDTTSVDGQMIASPAALIVTRGEKREIVDLAGK
ncbi:MAG: hypothetical protein ACYDBB_22015 [Armatimonadota bacterium]